MCAAYKLQMTAKQGYVWFLPHWLNDGWYVTDKLNENVNCTTREMLEVSSHHLFRTRNLCGII